MRQIMFLGIQLFLKRKLIITTTATATNVVADISG
ncbi:hypothetical protein FF38_10721 [Lucilia cuprina]|uniref:Uncharacterized protein n=1 Tax=Lucilia cuprina TaxID=7375 RepID=A0A0L0BT75_LUCCU|nr:hypothetical protein FF38_10721 [Lucilia cuprina]